MYTEKEKRATVTSNTKPKILVTILICILVLSAVIGVGIVSASNDEIIPFANITEKNLDYQDMIKMAFTLELEENAPEGTPGIIIWEDGMNTYTINNAIYTSYDVFKDENEKEYYLGSPIPTADLDKTYMVSVVIKTPQGTVISSNPEPFSVTMYAEERLSDLATIYTQNGALTEKEINQKNLYEKLLILANVPEESFTKYFDKIEPATFTTAEVLPVKNGANGIVVLMLDDGRLPSAEITDGILEKYGLVGDIAMPAYKIVNTSTGELYTEEIASWQTLLDTGRWKIVSHGYAHNMTNYNDVTSMEKEAQMSQQILRQAFPGQRVLTFAYPGADTYAMQYGYETVYANLRKHVEEYYIAGRYCRNSEYDPANGTWNVPIGTGPLMVGKDNDYYFHIAETGSEQDPDRLFYHVDLASKGYIYTLFQHGVLEDSEYDGNTYWVTRTYMDNLCKEIKKYVDAGTVWNTNYETAMLYLKEAEAASITATVSADKSTVTVKLADELNDAIFNEALTVRVNVPVDWISVNVNYGGEISIANTKTVDGNNVVEFDMVPDSAPAVLTAEITTENSTLESGFGVMLTDRIKIDTNYFPGFVRKAVTFTIDDGNITNDTNFLNIVKPAGILGTFNLINTKNLSAAEYRAFYEGYEVANHHQLHCLPMLDDVDFSGIEIKDELYNSSTSDVEYMYKTSTDGLYYVDYKTLYPSYTNSPYWHPIATNETYAEYVDITEKTLETVFGEGSVVGFAYPHGKLSAFVKQHLKDSGYLYARKTGNLKDSTNFAMPADRFEWTYNADVSSLNDVMAKFAVASDNGELRFFSFGVHSGDFNGKWDVLETFAETYGNRENEFYYATNRDIFEYEDAVNALMYKDGQILNNSSVTVYITVNNAKVIIPANSVYTVAAGATSSCPAIVDLTGWTTIN